MSKPTFSAIPLSIVIPTLNEEAYLPRLLESLVVLSKQYNSSIQVVVVDGNSQDKTVDVAASFYDRLPGLEIHRSKRGISIQRNAGVKRAKFENIVFCDADMEFTRGVSKKMGLALRGKNNFIAMPLIYPYDGKPIDFVLGTISYVYFFMVQRFNPVVSGMCIFTTKSVHNKIGGFDEQLKYAEDIDYGLRAVKSGASHYVFLGIRVRTSARRLDRKGRIKTGLTWLRWHRKIRKGKDSIHSSSDDYEFGKFTK